MSITGEHDAPLPLADLQAWVSEATYRWLEEADAKEAAFKKELEQESHMNASHMFKNEDDSDEDELKVSRVQTWASSTTNPDGIGGIFHDNLQHQKDESENDSSVKIIYILSESWHGFGDQPWAASRHIANMLADPNQCRSILQNRSFLHGDETNHPLLGVSFLELGAGAGVPGWTAMCCGARLVSTDQSVANRIRCMAECIERNWRDLNAIQKNGNEFLSQILVNARQARACPHDWGKPVDDVKAALGSDMATFDVIVGADCCYMPWMHVELLDSIDALLSEQGVALLPFALHGNTDDEGVWGIVKLAEDRGFRVDTLESKQLTPQKAGMGLKQGLVNTVRLTRASNSL